MRRVRLSLAVTCGVVITYDTCLLVRVSMCATIFVAASNRKAPR